MSRQMTSSDHVQSRAGIRDNPGGGGDATIFICSISSGKMHENQKAKMENKIGEVGLALKFTIGLIQANSYSNVGSLAPLPKLSPDYTFCYLLTISATQFFVFEFCFKMSSVKFNRLLIDDFIKSSKTKESRVTNFCLVLLIINEIIVSPTKSGRK